MLAVLCASVCAFNFVSGFLPTELPILLKLRNEMQSKLLCLIHEPIARKPRVDSRGKKQRNMPGEIQVRQPFFSFGAWNWRIEYSLYMVHFQIGAGGRTTIRPCLRTHVLPMQHFMNVLYQNSKLESALVGRPAIDSG